MQGKPFPKGNIPWNKKPPIVLICQFCKEQYTVTEYRKNISKHCSIQCHNIAISRQGHSSGSKNSQWKGCISPLFYIPNSIKIHGYNCQICNAKENIDTHHKDGNRMHNPLDGSNWQRLCIRFPSL